MRHPLAAIVLVLVAVGAFMSPLTVRPASRQAATKGAPAARVPDLSGVWMEREAQNTFTSKEPALQPWAEAKYKAAKPGYGPRASAQSEDPILSCSPPGVPRIMLVPFPMQIVQTPGLIVMLFEYDHFTRQIYLDRREHSQNLDPTWMGESIGRWEGDTLVVDTVGLNDKTWLDQVGHPHSDRLHVVERIRRTSHDTLQDDVTIDDSKAYTAPWTGQQVFKLRPNWHLIEYVCEDMQPGK